MSLKTDKRCLIISDGPVPTPEHKKVEGGGLRCWGLAKGLKDNQPDMVVDVAYNEQHVAGERFTDTFESIGIRTWNLESIQDLIKDYDTVIVSYCMGELSVKVADSVRVDQQLVLDCYVPIYIEVSARNGSDLESEYSAFNHDIPRWASVLRRGDLFLCASEPQKKFYEGVLAGLGRINPATYGEELIEIVPYGIYRDEPVQKTHPIQKLIGKNHSKYKKVLWFGGIYPWFNLEDLIESIIEVNKTLPTKLIIVGAKNPFNSHPDFIKKYDELIDFIKKNNYADTVLVQDWVSFDDRADWYLDSDVVVVINKEGQENELAWRTRLVDFTWANLPIITNGGDPVSKLLEHEDALTLFNDLSVSQMALDIRHLLENESHANTVKKNVSKVRNSLYWDVVTKRIGDQIIAHKKPGDFTRFGIYEPYVEAGGVKGKIKKVLVKVKKVPRYARKYGLKNTLVTSTSTIQRRLSKYIKTSQSSAPRVVVVSHQLDMSGAPFVIMDFAIAMKKAHPEMPMEFYTFNPAHHDNISELNKHGIKPKIIFNKDAVIDFNDGDVVVFNTVAQSQPLKDTVFRGLESGKIKKLFWYVHEDEPELIFSTGEAKYIGELMKLGKIEIVTAAVMTRDHYREYFNNEDAINIQPYQVITPRKYHKTLTSSDFKDKLSFVLPGTIGDGRKGQLPIFYAFADFLENTYSKNPDQYRDFELVYVGVGDDFLSRQIKKHATKALGNRFIEYGRVTKEECLEIIIKSNMTVCYSLRECLPLFVFEGMTAGHPILRNDSSGIDEQLEQGKNGYYLDSHDYSQIKEVIEEVLNKSKTTDKKLESMSKRSNTIALQQEKNTYDYLIEGVKGVFDAK
ncbi:MAG: glycosyltransferase [Candidatus Saccharimonadota bacterium]